MIWLTWRQFRVQAIVAAVVLAVTLVAAVVLRVELARLWTDSGASSCPASGACAALDAFLDEARHHLGLILLVGGLALIYLVPPLIGVFWGAPLVARELETGTHRLVWNQSVTPGRWLAAKLALLGGATATFAGLLSVAVFWSASRVDQVADDRITPLVFGARGIVPIGYAVFAFSLGVVTGALLRRTVPAMAVALAGYVAVLGTMTFWLRARLLPTDQLTRPLDIKKLDSFGFGPDGTAHVVAQPELPGAWVLANDTITPAGQIYDGPIDPQFCGRSAAPRACLDYLGTLGLRQDLSYHPASHFWPLQWIETGIFLGLAALLVAFGFWWLRRRPG